MFLGRGALVDNRGATEDGRGTAADAKGEGQASKGGTEDDSGQEQFQTQIVLFAEAIMLLLRTLQESDHHF